MGADLRRHAVVVPVRAQQLCAAVAPTGRRRVLAVDGKTLRGSRHTDRGGNVVVGRRLLAVIDQQTRVVLGQLDVAGKTNEITAFTPLLDTLTGIDLAGVVVTADALRRHRHNASYEDLRVMPMCRPELRLTAS
ncbi:transposase [Pseudonocardia sp. GCM10023141]|uniref:transposase n=1 Tax=Pseudonocardia sp. GCM10023141 TaxID=3252653 RepID=UPI00360F2A53